MSQRAEPGRGSDAASGREPTEICSPLCRYFRCGRKALDFRSNPPWCQWAEGPCTGYKCSYALCIQKKLLPNGRCALFIKRKTREERLEEIEADFKVGTANKIRKKLDKLGI